MSTKMMAAANVKQAVPFFNVTDIEAALRFYVDGLGCVVTNRWVPEGRIRWCWLQLGDAALMLQEYWRDGRPAGAPDGPLGQGVSVCFMCADAIAIYRELIARGVATRRPFVGNGLWVTSVSDADGYHLDFESPTDVPEETVYADEKENLFPAGETGRSESEDGEHSRGRDHEIPINRVSQHLHGAARAIGVPAKGQSIDALSHGSDTTSDESNTPRVATQSNTAQNCRLSACFRSLNLAGIGRERYPNERL